MVSVSWLGFEEDELEDVEEEWFEVMAGWVLRSHLQYLKLRLPTPFRTTASDTSNP